MRSIDQVRNTYYQNVEANSHHKTQKQIYHYICSQGGYGQATIQKLNLTSKIKKLQEEIYRNNCIFESMEYYRYQKVFDVNLKQLVILWENKDFREHFMNLLKINCTKYSWPMIQDIGRLLKLSSIPDKAKKHVTNVNTIKSIIPRKKSFDQPTQIEKLECWIKAPGQIIQIKEKQQSIQQTKEGLLQKNNDFPDLKNEVIENRIKEKVKEAIQEQKEILKETCKAQMLEQEENNVKDEIIQQEKSNDILLKIFKQNLKQEKEIQKKPQWAHDLEYLIMNQMVEQNSLRRKVDKIMEQNDMILSLLKSKTKSVVSFEDSSEEMESQLNEMRKQRENTLQWGLWNNLVDKTQEKSFENNNFIQIIQWFYYLTQRIRLKKILN